jgi:hypothetical protein
MTSSLKTIFEKQNAKKACILLYSEKTQNKLKILIGNEYSNNNFAMENIN